MGGSAGTQADAHVCTNTVWLTVCGPFESCHNPLIRLCLRTVRLVRCVDVVP